MSIALEIEAAKDYPARADEKFREQIDQARRLRERVGAWSGIPQDRGVDRSAELRPIERPAILRSVDG